nr:MAG TPA: Transcriptional Coactivator p15 (PC4) [Caudoviricetes sp.]
MSFIYSDTVDNKGVAHETVGENIRNGSKNITNDVYLVLTGKSGVTLTPEQLAEIKTYLGIAETPEG